MDLLSPLDLLTPFDGFASGSTPEATPTVEGFDVLDALQPWNPFGAATATADPPLVPCAPADQLSRGVAWLAGRLQASASQPVVYRRGNAAVALCATFGRTMLKLSDEFGSVRIEWTDRDFLIPAASLVLGGSQVLPRRGDVIHHNDGAQVHTYEVLPYGDEPHWRWSDPYRTLIRLHTKRTKSEPA